MEKEKEEKEERVPYWQIFYDNTFLLLFLGLAIFALSFTLWGLIDIANVQPSPDLKP